MLIAGTNSIWTSYSSDAFEASRNFMTTLSNCCSSSRLDFVSLLLVATLVILAILARGGSELSVAVVSSLSRGGSVLSCGGLELSLAVVQFSLTVVQSSSDESALLFSEGVEVLVFNLFFNVEFQKFFISLSVWPGRRVAI
ncbi:hypothetical protein E2542_SST15485 [Spatholobus suberectus]|nr:hypothetical protein E2542_SST15485 [Spatholobus suberectus]